MLVSQPLYRGFLLTPLKEHIVRFVGLIEIPSPQLILEYLLLGNLQDQHTQQPITDQESLTILCQSLDALIFVHEENIVHQNIKPENILVQSREPLHVKLSDFGRSKATTNLQTFCYAAPEIYTTSRDIYYTKACDIWSLGVVVFKYANGPLPDFDVRDVGLRWCEKIIKRADECDSDILLDFLSTAMLVIEPERRLPTRKCLEQALQLFAPFQSRCPTPTQSCNSASDCLKKMSDLHQVTPSATSTDIFEPYWLRDPNFVGPDIDAVGENLDEESSSWTLFHFEKPVSISAHNVSIEQNSSQSFPLKELEEPFVFEDYQSLYKPGTEWGQAGEFSGRSSDQPARIMQQPHGEDERVQPQ